MNKPSYTVDVERARFVFDSLIEVLRANRHPFNTENVPQADINMPSNLDMKNDPRSHALYLWASCFYMRGGIDSEVAFRRLTLIHERKKYLFEPEWFAANVDSRIVNGEVLDGKEVTALLQEGAVYKELSAELSAHGLGFSLVDNTRFWILDAVKLHKFWQGDPRRLFDEATNFEILVERIANRNFDIKSPNGFLGFKEKMVSMIGYFLGATGIIDLHKIPVPVDFHVLRLLIANEVIKPNWEAKEDESIFSFELLRNARDVTESYCKTHNIDMVELCNALWLFSRAMCSWHPDTESVTPEKSKQRVEEQKLRKNRKKVEEATGADRPPSEIMNGDEVTVGLGRRSKVIHVSPIWGDSQLRSYDRACGMCPLNGVCTGAVPAAPYYLKGALYRRKRTHPHWRPLFEMTQVEIRIEKSEWNKEVARDAAMEYLGEKPAAPVKKEEPKEPVPVQVGFGIDIEPNKEQRRLTEVPPRWSEMLPV